MFSDMAAHLFPSMHMRCTHEHLRLHVCMNAMQFNKSLSSTSHSLVWFLIKMTTLYHILHNTRFIRIWQSVFMLNAHHSISLPIFSVFFFSFRFPFAVSVSVSQSITSTTKKEKSFFHKTQNSIKWMEFFIRDFNEHFLHRKISGEDE